MTTAELARVERDEDHNYAWPYRNQPEPFTWGKVLRVHRVGEYAIVEYTPNTPRNHDGPLFHPFIDGKDTNHSYHTLDAAVVGCIALKHDGLNTRADRYFLRAIGAS